MKYFAYGSNISEIRLKLRVKNFTKLGIKILNDYKIEFSKVSKDGSGKSTIVKSVGSSVCGVLYDINQEDIKTLDKIEGLNYGYDKFYIEDFFTYIANEKNKSQNLKPFDWYLFLILDGMISNNFSDYYLNNIAIIETQIDSNTERKIKHYNQLVNINFKLIFNKSLRIFEPCIK